VNTAAPYLISWNVTKRCNLLCAHCYLDANELSGIDSVSTIEALRITDEAASLAPGAMLVLTGGEPLLRPDIFDIISRASGLGLSPVLGTNATMLTKEVCSRLLDSGIKGAGVSLDSLIPAFHDRFRGMEGAWKKTLTGMEALRAFNIPFQMQFTITKENRDEIERAASFAIEHGAMAINFFFLVCTGRGQKATDLTPEEYETALDIVRPKRDLAIG
jgi:MoaA/NifB/PqqE/SkfB family radical SAM enzyme